MTFVKRFFLLGTLTFILLVLPLTGCDVFEYDEVTDPNNPSAEAVMSGATEGQLRNLAFGLEDRHRGYQDAPSDVMSLLGAFGREVYAYFESDPNFTNAWLGLVGSAETNPSFFVDASAYDVPYIAVNQANLVLIAVDNTDTVDDSEKNGYRGFANTIKGFQLLIPLNTQWRDPGARDPAGSIRVDVGETLNPGPFLSYDDALAEIRSILDEGATQLNSAGNAFHFALSEDFINFGALTPQTLLQVNRAIAARAAIYAEDWQGALDALDGSFFELTEGEASMNRGAYHSYGDAPDTPNPYFFVRNTAADDIVVVHPSMIADALPGDARLDKFFERDNPVQNSNLPDIPGRFQDNRFVSTGDPFPFIRNEELILIYAEAHAQLNNPTEAVQAIDVIRTTWGLDPYTGDTSTEALIDEILFQRRYSLWAEMGHRWIDARRYGRLDEIQAVADATDGGSVFEFIARPQEEIDWETFVDEFGGGS